MMARPDRYEKREALARRRAFGWIRLGTLCFVLGVVLGAGFAGIALRPDNPGTTDRAAPYVVAVEPQEGEPLPAGNLTIQLAFSEALAEPPAVTLEGLRPIPIRNGSLEGDVWRGAVTILPGTNGRYVLTVGAARDFARNTMPPVQVAYLVDTEAPHTRTGAAVNRTTVPFPVTWDASDGNGSGVARVDLWYREASEPWSLLTSTSEAIGVYEMDPGDREATFSFCARATDRTGNREESCENGPTVAYDASPPGAALLPQAYWALGPVEIEGIAANDPDDAELRYFFSTDNETWQGPLPAGNSTNPFRWTFAFPLGGGHYRLHARARDSQGWIEPDQLPASAELALGLDLEAPVSRIDPVGAYWHPTSATISATASDERSGLASLDLYYTYRPNTTAAWSAWTYAVTRAQSPWTFDFDFPQGDGRYELATRAQDRAGRVEGLPPIGQGDVAVAHNALAPEAAVLRLLTFIDPAAKATNATWDASPAADVVRFELHRGSTASFVPDGMACETSGTCVASVSREERTAGSPLPQENVTYYLRVRTVDDGGMTSDGNAFGAVFHGSRFDTPNTYSGALSLPLGIAWGEQLRFAGVCYDCSDVFRISLARGDVLFLSLAVPATGDFRLMVASSSGTPVAESKRSGYGLWESLVFEALSAGTFYVVVDWSAVVGPTNRNEGWYTLAATLA